MKLQILDSDCSNRLQERLGDEYKAFHFYRNAANYCRTVGYDGGYSYFTKESVQELEHAKKVENFLCDWNVTPILQAIPKPPTFSGLVDIIEQAYTMELDLYDAYNTDALAILDEDSPTFTFLQEFLTIQRESVAEYSTLINKLELIGSDKFALFYFDAEVLGD